MILGKNLYSADGSVLLYEGAKLSTGSIGKLKQHGIVSVYIQSDCLRDVNIDDAVFEETRMAVMSLTKEAMEAAKIQHVFSVKDLEEQIERIMRDLLTSKDLLLQLIDIRAQKDYTFGHCVSVCIIALMIGIAMGYSAIQLRMLGLGALLHDIGKGKTPPDILEKPGRLTPAEFTVIQAHSSHGFEMLQHNGDIDVTAALVALQHHEKMDGTGYPWGLQGAEISEYARIVAVADVYDALTTDRVYRRRFMPHEALNMIERDANTHFDPVIVKAFQRYVAVYPPGSLVQLNTNKVAVVVTSSSGSPTRPVVRYSYKEKGIRKYSEIDLRVNPEIYIKKVIRA
jgi:putative nucleotidyltransferase with HDIG domain